MPQTLLLVDDREANLMVLEAVLEDDERILLQAASAQEGLKLLLENDVDLAILDVNMPEMSGLEFVRAVRGNPEYQALTLMMVTSESESSQIVKAVAAGANEYLLKPFSKDALREKLERLGIQ